MRRPTFATLKQLAMKGQLLHKVHMEHGPYGMEVVDQDNDGNKWYHTTSTEHLKAFKMTTNYLSLEEDHTGEPCLRLDNCCYAVYFYHESFNVN